MPPKTGATFDPTGTYRYSLWRSWDSAAPRITFVMLNPSTADAQTNDATIRRCIGFAQAWGYGYLEVVNLFALMATQPQKLRTAIEPVGKECDRYLMSAAAQAESVVIAWGNWGSLFDRDRVVLELLASQKQVFCLGVNQSGRPRHPLYVRSDTPLVPYLSLPGSVLSGPTLKVG